MAFMITLHNAGSPLNDNVKEQRKKEKNIILWGEKQQTPQDYAYMNTTCIHYMSLNNLFYFFS